MFPNPTANPSPLRLVPALPSTNPTTPAAAPLCKPQDQRVQWLMETMTANLSQPHTLRTLAALVEICPRQLERLFKEETGQSPLQYLHDLRLAAACNLLVTGFKNVTEIAAAVGFAQVNYFIRVFKARYGCPPLAYRKRSAGAAVAKKLRDVAIVL